MLARSALLFFSAVALIALLAGCDSGIEPPTPVIVEPEDRYPAFSPDGERLAYFHEEKHADSADDDPVYPTGLYVLDLSSGERTLLAEGYALTPDWSPDGKRLAFSGGDLFTVNIDGQKIHRVTTHGGAFFPAWSPDGERIAYDTSYEDPRGAKVVWLIRPDGTGIKDISEHGVGEWRDPDWSPEGEIVHLRFLTDVFGEEIFVMDSTGANPRRLTFNEKNDRSPAWSPDGEWIAWTAFEEDGTAALWIMRADGSKPCRLLGDAQEPTWAPDSERIVVSRGREGQERLTLWSLARDGSDLRQLTF